MSPSRLLCQGPSQLLPRDPQPQPPSNWLHPARVPCAMAPLLPTEVSTRPSGVRTADLGLLCPNALTSRPPGPSPCLRTGTPSHPSVG